MKKVLFGILALGILASCSSLKRIPPVEIPAPLVPQAPESPLKNTVDSMSYALGINLGTNYANNLKTIPGGKVNKDLLIRAFSETLKEDTNLLITNDKAQNYLREYFNNAQAKDNETKKAEGEKFLAENKKNDSVKVTASGLQYIVLKEGNGAKPTATDTVKVHYTGSLPDGKVFDSSVERGEPIEFPLNGVIPGWSEGVQLMTVGSKYKFFIPYQLAYGEQGIAQAGIPPFSPLVFEVELLGIKKAAPVNLNNVLKPFKMGNSNASDTQSKKTTKKK